MICRHCQQPIQRCTRIKSKGFIHVSGDCKGWVHAVDGWHSCQRSGPVWVFAEPEPGQPAVTETPTSKPSQEVA